MKRWLATLLFALLLHPSALAAQRWEEYDYENLEFRGIGLDFAGVWPSRVEQTFAYGLRADLGYVGPHVRIAPAMRFWSSRVRPAEVNRLAEQVIGICQRQPGATCPASLDLGEIKLSDLELSTEAHYLFAPPGVVSPYLGGGVGLHLLNGQGEAINQTFVEDLLDTVSPSVNLVAGLNLPLGRSLHFFTEARYVLVSDVRYATLGVGGSWSLPSPPRPTPGSSQTPGRP